MNKEKLIEKILKTIKDKKISFIELRFTGIFGQDHNTIIPSHELEKSFETGTWFDGSSIEGFVRISESDMYLRPDPTTFFISPFNNNEKIKIGKIICDIYTPDGEPFLKDPRYILKHQDEIARKKGWIFKAASELEFFIFKRENGELSVTPHDDISYFESNIAGNAPEIRLWIMSHMEDIGIKMEMGHHEVAPGQHEIDFVYDDAVKMADYIQTYKYIVKSVAYLHNYEATFMPKPEVGISGSGMHTHFSLFNEKGENIFYDKEKELSDIANSFFSGILKYIKEMALITNPTVNSYKRLVPGYEAPVLICAGKKNRSALIRIPATRNVPKSTRGELRNPDPSANPYLLFAVMLGAGLKGIEENLPPPIMYDDNIYELSREERKKRGIGRLPNDMGHAIKFFESSKLMREILGDELFDFYLETKIKEYHEYQFNQISDWEISRYFNI
ncbi:type I glutamate--ammonia ligase [candidate division KSB1 bacterium]|nr:MAG: type I glutamate--ammonia ligase [candidate division KSB1 bacterium]